MGPSRSVFGAGLSGIIPYLEWGRASKVTAKKVLRESLGVISFSEYSMLNSQCYVLCTKSC